MAKKQSTQHVNYNLEKQSNKKRQQASNYRDREYLYPSELAQLLEAAKREASGNLWYCLLLLMHRHAYRVSEVCALKWSDIDFVNAQIRVNRLKGSVSGVHPLAADEIKALKKLHRNKSSTYVFISCHGQPLASISVNKALERLGVKAELENLKLHPHMLRHSAAVHYLNKTKDLFLTQQFLGHKSIDNTMKYLKLTPGRLESVGEWFK